MTMRILFIGDIVGSPGVSIVRRALPHLVASEDIDLVIANAENAAAGSGLTPGLFRKLHNSGVNLFTMGDHIYKKNDIRPVLEQEDCICKPANYPPEAPGRDFITGVAKNGVPVAVISLMGRTFMKPVDCPFAAADRVLDALDESVRCIIVDMHAEATADKYLMAHHLKGRVSAVFGTHTHVPTADEQIFPDGTAFQCDVGMTGPYASILGRRVDRVLSTTRTFIPSSFDVAKEDVRLAGALVELDEETGKATAIRRVMVTESDVEAMPAEIRS